ncbi:partial Chemotaxis protein CheA, partial [uncultured bacterium]
MSIDMSQFFQVFFEESAEHLAEMERLLLEMDVESPDIEEMNAIFRAAHSIKGGSGTFGFTDMTEVTHVLENLLDRLRKGEMAPRTEMIDAFLEAADVLKEQLACHINGTDAEPHAAEAICNKLRALTQDQPAPGEGAAQSSATSEVAPNSAIDEIP